MWRFEVKNQLCAFVHLFVSCIFSCISIVFVPKSDRSTSTGKILDRLNHFKNNRGVWATIAPTNITFLVANRLRWQNLHFLNYWRPVRCDGTLNSNFWTIIRVGFVFMEIIISSFCTLCCGDLCHLL